MSIDDVSILFTDVVAVHATPARSPRYIA